jgi:hypothetical protein
LRDVKKLNEPGIQQNWAMAGRRPAPVQSEQADVRKLRRRLGLGILKAAEQQAEISPGFLRANELARANPSVATLQRLAATYHMTVLDALTCHITSGH